MVEINDTARVDVFSQERRSLRHICLLLLVLVYSRVMFYSNLKVTLFVDVCSMFDNTRSFFRSVSLNT